MQNVCGAYNLIPRHDLRRLKWMRDGKQTQCEDESTKSSESTNHQVELEAIALHGCGSESLRLKRQRKFRSGSDASRQTMSFRSGDQTDNLSHRWLWSTKFEVKQKRRQKSNLFREREKPFFFLKWKERKIGKKVTVFLRRQTNHFNKFSGQLLCGGQRLRSCQLYFLSVHFISSFFSSCFFSSFLVIFLIFPIQ